MQLFLLHFYDMYDVNPQKKVNSKIKIKVKVRFFYKKRHEI